MRARRERKNIGGESQKKNMKPAAEVCQQRRRQTDSSPNPTRRKCMFFCLQLSTFISDLLSAYVVFASHSIARSEPKNIFAGRARSSLSFANCCLPYDELGSDEEAEYEMSEEKRMGWNEWKCAIPSSFTHSSRVNNKKQHSDQRRWRRENLFPSERVRVTMVRCCGAAVKAKKSERKTFQPTNIRPTTTTLAQASLVLHSAL